LRGLWKTKFFETLGGGGGKKQAPGFLGEGLSRVVGLWGGGGGGFVGGLGSGGQGEMAKVKKAQRKMKKLKEKTNPHKHHPPKVLFFPKKPDATNLFWGGEMGISWWGKKKGTQNKPTLCS